MTDIKKTNSKTHCDLCNKQKKVRLCKTRNLCSSCQTLISVMKKDPQMIKKIWLELYDEPIIPRSQLTTTIDDIEPPDVLDGKRYRTVDRENNKWYLSVSEVDGNPVEVFASTAFDRDDHLQSRISNLTTITRLTSLILRHIFLGERLTLDKCLKQLQRSSRQPNDLPDMLYGVLDSYTYQKPEDRRQRTEAEL